MPGVLREGQGCANACDTCAGSRSGFCRFLTPEKRARFLKHTYRARYAPGSEICLQDEHCDRVGIVASGLVKNVAITENGDEHLIQLVGPGQFIGEPSLERNSFSSEAAVEVEVCWIPETVWQAFLDESPAHYRAFLATMAQQFEDTRRTVVKMRGRTASQRVAMWLLDQVPQATGGRPAIIQILLSRRDLASLLDMTVETLCRSLHQIDERGAISMIASDVVEVTNLAKLKLLAKWQDDRVGETLNPPAFGRTDAAHGSWSRSDRDLTMARREAPRVGGDRRQ